VTGQQGGRQRHVRFSAGETHYIVFEGVDGALAARPGRTYSGIAVVAGANGERELASLTCRGRPAIAPGFTEVVAALLPPDRRGSIEEVTGGPFDAWY